MAGKEKSVDIQHVDLVNIASETSKLSAKDIDLALDSYEGAITQAINEAFEKNEDIETVNVFSKVTGISAQKVDSEEFGKHIGIVPLVKVDMFEKLNAKYGITEETIEAAAEIDSEEKKAKKAS